MACPSIWTRGPSARWQGGSSTHPRRRARHAIGGPRSFWRRSQRADSATASSTGLVGSCDTADSWTRGSLATPTPRSRAHVTAVWTGSVMLIWAGISTPIQECRKEQARGMTLRPIFGPDLQPGCSGAPNGTYGDLDGKRDGRLGGKGYGPASGCSGVVAFNSCEFIDGARYDPASDRWTKISAAGAPAARHNHTAVWTGERDDRVGRDGCDFSPARQQNLHLH